MELLEAINIRHSVRSYEDKAIEPSIINELEKMIKQCNIDGGLHMQLILNEPKAFTSMMAHYGKFNDVKNYIVLAGKRSETLAERCGYYGEKIVLKAQQLGLNSCWVALTFNKRKAEFILNENEKLVCVIAIGYGKHQGVPHKSKPLNAVCKIDSHTPKWFIKGVEAALLAPTAVNQQKFSFSLKDNFVELKMGLGFNINIDKGILKYHFEIGANTENFRWKK